jgi:ribonuclease-3
LLSLNAIKLLFSKNRTFCVELKPFLGYLPAKPELYKAAFIHRSAPLTLKDGSVVTNERLEYLGDAILDAVIAAYLFNKYPNRDEGFLSQMRSKIVKRKYLNTLSVKIGLRNFIDKHLPNGNCGKHFYGDSLEALIGAIYIDKGFLKSQHFIINRLIHKYIDLDNLEFTETDFKSRVIEWAQKSHQEIRFESEEEYNTENKTPLFICRIYITNELFTEGKGVSKKDAEQHAAEAAYMQISDK